MSYDQLNIENNKARRLSWSNAEAFITKEGDVVKMFVPYVGYGKFIPSKDDLDASDWIYVD